MTYQLELKHISKSYGDLKANDDVSLRIKPGSIHALLGENGAGKSTLVNIIYGLVMRDAGEICWEGQPIEIGSPVKARQVGIGIVFQHFALFNVMSVAENIALGISYPGTLTELRQHIAEVSQQYKLDINADAIVGDLSAGEMQRVEIIRCLLQKPKLLILDEPTSVLTPVEVEQLFVTLEKLRDGGCSIMFIGHKLDEIKRICDEGTVLRHGKLVGECQLNQMSVAEIAEMMVGSKVSEYAERHEVSDSAISLAVSHNEPGLFSVQSLQLKRGCITGIAGIAGNGQDALMSFLAGEISGSRYRASIEFKGQAIGHWGVGKRNAAGILFVPTERLGRSAVTQLSLMENALLGVSDRKRFVRNGLINQRALTTFSEQIINDFNVKASGSEALASSLSGGNLQKYIVGRAISQHPKVLLISNPTWGVDVNSAVFIRNSLLRLRDAGVAILVSSEDLDEMFSICDEMAVIKEGELGETRPVKSLKVQQVGLMMTA